MRQTSTLKYSKRLKREYSSLSSFSTVVGRLTKRLFDFIASLFGLILLSPLFIYIAHLIRRDSPGPVFYWGPRAGLGGKAFRMLKFRTMYECEKSYLGPHVTCKEDDRITPIGRWLRDTKVNELPQLWNVLIGEMSLVGPRPEDPEIVETWGRDAREEILSVKPGVTSPASILYHDEEALLSASNVMGDYFKDILPDKMRLDRLYVRNHSFFADLDIIFWTIAILLPRVVKTGIPEGYLFAGPLSRFIDRYVSWFLVDLFVAFGSFITAILLWRAQEPLNWGGGHLIVLSILMAVMFSGINSFAGLNRIVWSEAITEDASGLMFSAATATILTLVFNYWQSVFQVLPYPALPITMIFTTGLMASIGFIVVRYRWRLLTGFASRWVGWRGRKSVTERVLIIGSGEGNQVANWLLRQGDASRVFSIVGMVDNEHPTMQGMQVKGLRVLGSLNDVPRLIQRHDVGVVVFAVPNAAPEFQEKVSEVCRQSNTRIVLLADMLATLQKQLTQPGGRNRTDHG